MKDNKIEGKEKKKPIEDNIGMTEHEYKKFKSNLGFTLNL